MVIQLNSNVIEYRILSIDYLDNTISTKNFNLLILDNKKFFQIFYDDNKWSLKQYINQYESLEYYCNKLSSEQILEMISRYLISESLIDIVEFKKIDSRTPEEINTILFSQNIIFYRLHDYIFFAVYFIIFFLKFKEIYLNIIINTILTIAYFTLIYLEYKYNEDNYKSSYDDIKKSNERYMITYWKRVFLRCCNIFIIIAIFV